MMVLGVIDFMECRFVKTEDVKPTILIAEENDSTRRWLHGNLEKDYKVLDAKNVDQMIQILEESKIDLVIIDDSLSHKVGLEFCEAIRKRRRFLTLPVLVLTSPDSPESVREIFDVGATDFIPRPLNTMEIKMRIDLALKFGKAAEEMAKVLEKFKKLSERDPLTDLYNRYVLNNQVVELISKSREDDDPLSVLMIDIDYFKEINDSRGHLAGDEVLVSLSELLKDTLREQDLIIRYGGEEFIIFLPYTTKNQALYVAEKLCQRVSEKDFQTQSGEVKMTISIGGISVNTHSPLRDEAELEELLKSVDKALFEAKNKGKNQVVVHEQKWSHSK
ncbi:MAG: two-component system cell cycle response regulator [Chlamydiales bacterium]|jgi:two-component system cell cycle response regulator